MGSSVSVKALILFTSSVVIPSVLADQVVRCIQRTGHRLRRRVSRLLRHRAAETFMVSHVGLIDTDRWLSGARNERFRRRGEVHQAHNINVMARLWRSLAVRSGATPALSSSSAMPVRRSTIDDFFAIADLAHNQAYHSSFNEEPNVRQVGNVAILPIKTRIRGPAPIGALRMPSLYVISSCHPQPILTRRT